jgi:hypothetical protein
VFFQVDQNADLSAFLIGDKLDSAYGFIVLQVTASPHCTCPLPPQQSLRPCLKRGKFSELPFGKLCAVSVLHSLKKRVRPP